MRVPANLSGATTTRTRAIRQVARTPTVGRRVGSGWSGRCAADDVPGVAERRLGDARLVVVHAVAGGAEPPGRRARAAERRGVEHRPAAASTRVAPAGAGRLRVRTDPGGCWVGRGRHGHGRLRHVVDPRADVVPGDLRGAPRPAGRRRWWRQLLEAALHHGRGCLRGMLSASSNPEGRASLPGAGFTLHPQMFLTGPWTGPRSRWWRRCARVGGRHRADGLPRPPHPRRGARPRPPADALVVAAARLRHQHRSGYVYTSRPGRSSCSPPATAGRRPGCSGRCSRTPRARRGAAPDGRQPVGGRHRPHRPARAAPGGLPRPARDETAGAVRSQWCLL